MSPRRAGDPAREATPRPEPERDGRPARGFADIRSGSRSAAPPRGYTEIVEQWSARKSKLVAEYTTGRRSFLPWCPPPEALVFSAREVLAILEERFGEGFERARRGEVRSPVAARPDGGWVESANLLGINVRTLGSFWKIVPYLLTVPAAWNAVHLLPIWEPGVAGSLYGISSWGLNEEFFSPELAEELPELDTVERQLRFVIDVIHLSGRAAGLDVIPHTDRFSQIVLAQPWCFEWVQREDTALVDHGDRVIARVERVIFHWLRESGAAIPGPVPETPGELFRELGENERTELLFGPHRERRTRNARRDELIGRLHRYGYEPLPATMAPPFRGLEIDPDSRHTDEHGRIWRDYRFSKPGAMSRVFGPLTRYRLYHGVDETSWELDFSKPVTAVWEYVADRYAECCATYGFDFMRGDMSHVQMRPDGVPAEIGEFYDILGFVKRRVAERCSAPYFAYFAESFLAPRDVFGYGEEIDHLEASQAEAALGDLQSLRTGTPEFMRRLRRYLDLAQTRRCKPSITVITGDKDDPRFDELYRAGNAARYFTAVFLTDLPSYTALGFETREVRTQPAANDYYTKLYVFRESGESNLYPSKAVHGPYRWSTSGAQFAALTRIRLFAERVLPEIRHRRTRLLLAPDPEGETAVMAWTQDGPRPAYLFIVNFSTDRDSGGFGLPLPPAAPESAAQSDPPGGRTGAVPALEPVFSTDSVIAGGRGIAAAFDAAGCDAAGSDAAGVRGRRTGEAERDGEVSGERPCIAFNGCHYHVENLPPGVGCVFRYRF